MAVAGEELLHGGLFEVALLGDEPVQRADQRIHIAQRRRDGALLGQRRDWGVHPPKIGLPYVCVNGALTLRGDLSANGACAQCVAGIGRIQNTRSWPAPDNETSKNNRLIAFRVP